MHFSLPLSLFVLSAYGAPAVDVSKRAPCTSYTIINTRGTGEVQGPSAGFRTMNSNIQQKVKGGKIVRTDPMKR